MRDGLAAETLLEQLAPIFERLGGETLADWRAAETTDEREQCWHDMNALDRLKDRLKGNVKAGKDARAMLERAEAEDEATAATPQGRERT